MNISIPFTKSQQQKCERPGFGKVHERSEAAATKANENTYLNQENSRKTLQGRNKWLHDQFDKAGNGNQKLSVLGGEMSELGELLMAMRRARNDMESQENAKKNAAKKRKADGEKVGEQLVSTAP